MSAAWTLDVQVPAGRVWDALTDKAYSLGETRPPGAQLDAACRAATAMALAVADHSDQVVDVVLSGDSGDEETPWRVGAQVTRVVQPAEAPAAAPDAAAGGDQPAPGA